MNEEYFRFTVDEESLKHYRLLLTSFGWKIIGVEAIPMWDNWRVVVVDVLAGEREDLIRELTLDGDSAA